MRLPENSTCGRWLPLILTVGSWVLIGLAHSVASAQNAKSDLTRAEVLYRDGAWSEAAQLFLRVKDETPQVVTPDVERRRRLCLTRLVEIHRRLGNYKEALLFALDEREQQRVLRGPDAQDESQRNALVIAECHAALTDYAAADAVLQDLLKGRLGTVKSFPKFQALVDLAVLDQLRDRAADSAAHWREANSLGRELWSRFRTSLPPESATNLLQRLVECQEALNDEAAVGQFFAILLDDKSEVRSGAPSRTVRLFLELGTRAALRGDVPHAKAHLREALRRSPDDKPSRQRAHAHQLLAQLLLKHGEKDSARAEQGLAADQLEQLLKDPQATPTTQLADLKQLRGLYLNLDRVSEAAAVGERLLARQSAELGADHPQVIESRALIGSLYGSLGEDAKARRLLTQTVETLRQPGRSPIDLARALNNLGAVERSIGEFAEAGRCFKEALALREQHLPADHLDLATSYNNLANVYLAQAKFTDAIELYIKVHDRCVQLGQRADGLRSVTLLNLAMSYKSQGQWELAAKYCQRSLELLEEFEGRDTISAVGHYNAMATLVRSQGRLAEAYSWAQKTLTVCAAHPQNPRAAAAVAGARIQMGMIACLAQDYGRAAEHWQKALQLHHEHQQTAQIPGTLNLLGVLAFQQQNYDEAQQYLEKADLALNDFESTPQDRYNTLCNLAAVYHHNKRTPEAIARLQQAIAIPETIRLETFGEAELGRAKFLAQFASAYEMLVQWHLEADDLNAAFLAAEQSRNRTFLDQLNLAGVDLLSTLREESKGREREQRVELHRLRQQARRLAEQRDSTAVTEAMKKVRDAEAAYAQLFNELRDSSPVYRRLLTQDKKLASLDELRESLGPDTLCLFYFLGSQRSDVLVFGSDPQPAIRLSLEVTAAQAKQLPALPWLRGSKTELAQRGIGGIQETEKGPLVETEADVPKVNAGAVTRRQVAELVTWYRQALSQRRFDSERGVGGVVETSKGEKVADNAFTTLTDILFPLEVRREIQRRRPKTIVLIPDGALHNLPFEALLVSAGQEPRFVLDDFPPIAYAPSANILANLRRRPAVPTENLRRLLTVGPQYGRPSATVATTIPEKPTTNVAEAKVADSSTLLAQVELTRDLFEGMIGPLPELKGARRECERLESSFKQRGLDVLRLLETDATESRFTEVVGGCGLIHLAAHGLVDERYGNLFGAIALSPSANEQLGDADDGLLSYREILKLPLNRCELAVLSACQTNVGPNRPLEAGSTLAQAFLAAGARRVVASQWSVSDASTSELVTTFLESIANSLQDSHAPSFASALHQAKQQIRRDKRWAAPYY